jgi:hypothetical protein
MYQAHGTKNKCSLAGTFSYLRDELEQVAAQKVSSLKKPVACKLLDDFDTRYQTACECKVVANNPVA